MAPHIPHSLGTMSRDLCTCALHGCLLIQFGMCCSTHTYRPGVDDESGAVGRAQAQVASRLLGRLDAIGQCPQVIMQSHSLTSCLGSSCPFRAFLLLQSELFSLLLVMHTGCAAAQCAADVQQMDHHGNSGMMMLMVTCGSTPPHPPTHHLQPVTCSPPLTPHSLLV
jgi:hypothetical protein